ncbi:hypothetical protein GLOIN_2v1704829 [Rhizophagus irregularis DAOM 181602=DAOM 197198]|uniref:Uncharacterized protein n=1 Tax=Rhizophagus irregularis (strain DAOM 181602 / DAOM 197198 / MUCL 43194) TaxID=747089 RepID=A0A2P4P7E2_RHIID|nr:hypothetical protein GLOIN_2v1704829 [Rhizophagus irregularis DAOM 181602=DAOM 197198]POG61305.1 hypothetical protein GLOIN_2v1704829 [Rhizophagus irregularis DAOM 181602=DAOM 197198]GET51099.1 hypothetical protein GLOIN_2v1704829 [Rhizophagus irregularis DAOM 181602=DAOM 197198]|eukprot:XP_025168171.1 hypothetical protein GLOIN_2v1704829 [Rhizophagus irregularis DAOM 181602=DAOM 197198]
MWYTVNSVYIGQFTKYGILTSLASSVILVLYMFFYNANIRFVSSVVLHNVMAANILSCLKACRKKPIIYN